MSIYDTLNPEQKKAVLQTEGPVLILAGAGSGKTRVLTHRVAFLIDQCGVNPWNIMAITFTNKAAGEMRERVDKIVGFGSESIWVTTFHSTCVRILRRFADRLGYQTNFTIYDSDDSKSVMKDICKRYQLETQSLKLRRIMNVISSSKDNLVTPDEYSLSTMNDSEKIRIAKAYQEYQANLKKNNAMDFDDLISKTVELFKTCPDVLDYYQERFRYIMVDEYQDTNNAQFELIRLLASKYRNLCVVGDDDQSIYRFRGANIRNILDFETVYQDATVIKLEQNYRSTQNILDAANQVIRNNNGRKDKSLWTEEGSGEKIRFCKFDAGPEEAAFIAEDITKLKKDGKADYSDIAVLYRTNAQSRLIEERFILNGIPYDIVGGTNFYARREIKDLLAYLKTIDKMQNYADTHLKSFYDALAHADEVIGGKAAEKIQNFDLMIRAFRTKAKEYSIEALIRDIISTIGYMEYLKALDEEDESSGDNDRAQNVDELISKVVSYEEKAEEPSLSGFLEEVALVADIDKVSGDDNKVLLMTLHSAKGLEFQNVYLAGMEEGLFPSYMTLQAEESDPAAMEEERRLAYVGITRARKNLTITAARARMIHGELQYNRVSRFVEEIPRELVEEQSAKQKKQPAFLDDDDSDDAQKDSGSSYGYGGSGYAARSGYGSRQNAPVEHEYGSSIYGLGRRPKAAAARKKPSAVPDKPFIAGASSRHAKAALGTLSKGMPSASTPEYTVGDRVEHIKYGIGTVAQMEQGPRDYKVTVAFDECGQKIMYAAFAKLKKV